MDTHHSLLSTSSCTQLGHSQFFTLLMLEGTSAFISLYFLGLVPTGRIFVNTIQAVFRCLPQFPLSVMSLSRLCFGKAEAPGSRELTPEAEARRWPSRYLRVTLGARRGHPSLLPPGFLPQSPCSVPWSTAHQAPSWGYTQPCPWPHPETAPSPSIS